MFENYLSPYIRLAISTVLILIAGWNAQAQSPTKLIYTQQSLTSADDRLNTASLTGSFPASATALATGLSSFTQPNDVVFDPVNNFIYLVDNTLSTGPIIRYLYNSGTNTVSNSTTIVTGTTGATYQGLALDVANNRLYFTQSSTDNALDAIKVVSGITGSSFTVTLLATGNTAAGDFNSPNELLFDPTNNYLYVVDQFQMTGPILRFTTNGTSLTNRTVAVAATGVASTNYGGLALDQFNNQLYITQFNTTSAVNSSLDAIKVVTLSGTPPYIPTTVVDGTTASFTQPTDLALDRVNNYLYVSNQTGGSATNFILRYTTTGTGQTTVVSPSTAIYGGITLNGGFSEPISLTSSTPADNATGVSPTTNIVLNFNRAVTKGTGSFEIRRTSDDSVIETIAVGSTQVTGSGATWTIDPLGTLAAGTTYALRASSGVFTATDGGSFTGISNNTALNFTTNATPTDITLSNNSVAENQPSGTSVGNFTTTDADAGQTFSYSLVSGAGSDDNAMFLIDGSQLKTNAMFNFETKSSYTIRVQTTDNGTPALSFQKAFAITITNVNEPPVINPQSFTVNENAPNGTVVGTVVASDPDASTTLSYSITNGNTSGAFSFSGNSLRVANSAALNFETTPTFTLTVQVSDGSLSSSASVTVNVNNVNELAVSISAKTDVICNGGTTGAATATASGESAPFSYNWRNTTTNTTLAQTTSAVTGLTAGTYSVTVTATASGFTAATSFTISQPTALSVSGSQTRVSTLGGSDGTATVSVSGGSPGYSYNWTPGNPTGDGTSSVSSLSAGIYNVTISDANGCTATSSATITTAPDLTPLLYARPTVQYGTAAINVVVDVVEINNVATSGLITVKVTKASQFTLTFDNGATTIGGRSVQNGAWTFSTDANYYILTTSQVVAAGNKLSFGFSGMSNPGATTGTLSNSVTISAASGGEIRDANNVDADKIQYFPQ